jgi:hypothetical protein
MLLGATGVKAVHKYIGEIEPWCQFQQPFMSSFYAPRSQKFKKTDGLSVFLPFWDLCA